MAKPPLRVVLAGAVVIAVVAAWGPVSAIRERATLWAPDCPRWDVAWTGGRLEGERSASWVRVRAELVPMVGTTETREGTPGVQLGRFRPGASIEWGAPWPLDNIESIASPDRTFLLLRNNRERTHTAGMVDPETLDPVGLKELEWPGAEKRQVDFSLAGVLPSGELALVVQVHLDDAHGANNGIQAFAARWDPIAGQITQTIELGEGDASVTNHQLDGNALTAWCIGRASKWTMRTYSTLTVDFASGTLTPTGKHPAPPSARMSQPVLNASGTPIGKFQPFAEVLEPPVTAAFKGFNAESPITRQSVVGRPKWFNKFVRDRGAKLREARRQGRYGVANWDALHFGDVHFLGDPLPAGPALLGDRAMRATAASAVNEGLIPLSCYALDGKTLLLTQLVTSGSDNDNGFLRFGTFTPPSGQVDWLGHVPLPVGWTNYATYLEWEIHATRDGWLVGMDGLTNPPKNPEKPHEGEGAAWWARIPYPEGWPYAAEGKLGMLALPELRDSD